MSRALIVIESAADRVRAVRWCNSVPLGTRVEFKETKRTLPQNSRMWAMLSDIAAQKTHHGRRYDTEEWKTIFLHALGREVQFIPALDSSTFIPLGNRSSDLSKDEMSQLIEFMLAWGQENGVTFHDRTADAA